MQKKWNQSQKYFGLKKAYLNGHPVIQAVEAKMLGTFTKYSFLQNNSSRKKSAISIHYELIGGVGGRGALALNTPLLLNILSKYIIILEPKKQ